MFLRQVRLNSISKSYKNNNHNLVSNILCKDYCNVTQEEDVQKAPPHDAKVVICGGGIMGATVAYHLANLGWAKETVLIEQNR